MATILPFRKSIPQVLVTDLILSQGGSMARPKNPKSAQEGFFTSDKTEQLVLCKISSRRPVRTNSPDSVTPTNLYRTHGHITGIHASLCGDCSLPASSFTVLWPKNPLRRVTSRAPQYADSVENGTLKAYSYLDTLECGHQVFVQPHIFWDEKDHLIEQPPINKRRRCPECGHGLSGKAVKVEQKKRGAA